MEYLDKQISVEFLAISYDSKFLVAINSKKKITVYNLLQGNQYCLIDIFKARINHINFQPNKYVLATACNDG